MGDWDVVAARQSTDAVGMHRFPTNKFTSVRGDGSFQVLIRELIIAQGSAHASSLFYAGSFLSARRIGLQP